MKLRIGSPATGDHFYPRPALREALLRALQRDHVAFLGPRRTGKTSLLLDVVAQPPDGVTAVFLNLEKESSVQAWFEKMLEETRKALNDPGRKWAWLQKAGKGAADTLKRIEQISPSGFKLSPGQPSEEAWRPVGDQFLEVLRQSGMPIYFLIDEFPSFLSHVAKHSSLAEVEAVLNWFRDARQSLASMSARFLVTGSIGLDGLLRRLGLSPAANDFDPVDIPPLTEADALNFLAQVAEGEGVAISAAGCRRILKRLGSNWPILLSLFISEIQEAQFTKSPTIKEIDELYERQIIRGNRNRYCANMHDRLKEIFTPSECRLAREILRDLCRSKSSLGSDDFHVIHVRLVPDAALRSLAEDELDYVLETLRHDGYLLRGEDGLTRFASHMLRDFWRHRTA